MVYFPNIQIMFLHDSVVVVVSVVQICWHGFRTKYKIQ